MPEKDLIVQIVGGLINENTSLQQRIEQEKIKLQQRNHELSVLYNVSAALSYYLSYQEIASLIMNSLYSILTYDFCSILLHDISENKVIYLKSSPYLHKSFIDNVISNVYKTAETFFQQKIDYNNITVNSEQISIDEAYAIDDISQNIRSFINIPLSFKGEIIGITSLCSVHEKAFSREKIAFAYTIANQMATVLGRLSQLVESEKKRISHLIEHLEDAIIILDTNQQPLTLNKQARALFGFKNKSGFKKIAKILQKIKISHLVKEALQNNTKISGQEISIQKNQEILIFLVNIDPVYSSGTNFFSGIAISLKNISYLKKIEKEKSEKIAIINKARELINSIANQEKLFSILGDYILNVANADMGALYLLEKKVLCTKSSWVLPTKSKSRYISEFEANFPESIEFITMATGDNLLKKTIQARRTLIFKNIPLKKNFLLEKATKNSQEVDIVLKELISVPLLSKERVIGILTVIRKDKPEIQELSKDDIETLETIASLSASAIENAYLYQKTLNEQKIQQELKLAHEIQKRILPKKLPKSTNFEYGGISIPARGIGGDYYDFFQVNKNDNNHIGIAIIDVIGKGIPAALITIMIKSIIQINVKGFQNTKEVIKNINIAVLNEPAITKFVPMFYCIINDSMRELRYTNAGHEVPLLFVAKTDEFLKLDTEGFPVGGLEDIDYEQKSLILAPGDILSIYTDGIVEARSPEGENFGEDRLQKYIRKYKHLPSNKIVDKIYTSLINFVKDAPQHDDITLVIIKAKDLDGISVRHQDKVLWEKQLHISSATKNVKLVREAVEEASKIMGFNTSAIYDIKLAVNEAHANIIKHAYGNDPDQNIIFKVTVFVDRVEYYFQDFGKTYGELAIKQTRSLDDFQGNGLGVFLIKSTMDDVTYKIDPGKGTELIMIKYSEQLENNV
ncbi:MAG TPA: hypothetical protein DCS13_03165 [Candidatus Margulisbacteria bacterium]|nr:MAG: hypothetical protein A2X41_06880 [Candidatus Margulisbacteria bacterium GWE2_39_32]HAR62441.1 hypothetical protein [Candidatus Margulisiibacteriota bacterium]